MRKNFYSATTKYGNLHTGHPLSCIQDIRSAMRAAGKKNPLLPGTTCAMHTNPAK